MIHEGDDRDRGWAERSTPLWVALAVAGLALVIGLAAGWLLLGRSGSRSADMTVGPAELAPQWQQEWVQLVADDYARTRDPDRALELLAGIGGDDLSNALSALSTEDRTALQQHTAGLLAQGIGASTAAGATGDDREAAASSEGDTEAEVASGVDRQSAETPGVTDGRDGAAADDGPAGAEADDGTAAPLDGERSGLFRAIAVGVLLLAAGALAFIGWSWLRWRRERAGRRTRVADPVGRAPQSHDTLAQDEEAVGDAGSSTGHPGHPETGQGAVPWRPLRIDLGTSATVSYEPSAERFYQTWLVNDERGSLVGGVGLRSQDIGRVAVLELWFFRRGESGTDEDTATVTLAAQAACDDGVIRARLGDRDVLTALPGGQRVLAVADLELDVEIAAADSGLGDDRTSLSTVTLVLTPRRAARLGEQSAAEPPEQPS